MQLACRLRRRVARNGPTQHSSRHERESVDRDGRCAVEANRTGCQRARPPHRAPARSAGRRPFNVLEYSRTDTISGGTHVRFYRDDSRPCLAYGGSDGERWAGGQAECRKTLLLRVLLRRAGPPHRSHGGVARYRPPGLRDYNSRYMIENPASGPLLLVPEVGVSVRRPRRRTNAAAQERPTSGQ